MYHGSFFETQKILHNHRKNPVCLGFSDMILQTSQVLYLRQISMNLSCSFLAGWEMGWSGDKNVKKQCIIFLFAWMWNLTKCWIYICRFSNVWLIYVAMIRFWFYVTPRWQSKLSALHVRFDKICFFLLFFRVNNTM